MISHASESMPAPGHAPSVAASGKAGPGNLIAAVLNFPLFLYLFSMWTVGPFALGDSLSLTFAMPALLLISPLIVQVSRRHVLESLSRVRIEFILLGVIFLLSVLSISNSNAPFRSFRIIFPCLLPAALLVHLTVGSGVSRNWLLKIPRYLLIAGFLLSVAPSLASYFVPALETLTVSSYRSRSLFENSIQNGIALATLVPLLVVELALARRMKDRIFWAGAALLLALALFKAGAKSPMFFSTCAGTLLFLVLTFRTRNLVRVGIALLALVLAGMFLSTFGLTIAEKLNPEIAAKIDHIVNKGVHSYHSIRERKLLWHEAIEQGKAHWLIGSGAGEKVLGLSHAHNLVLDYFKGVGFFGAAAIALLCVTILFRTCRKAISVLAGTGDECDQRVLACYVSASVYVVCNQISDCFGPSTIGFLWLIYLTGVLADRPAWRRNGARAVT